MEHLFGIEIGTDSAPAALPPSQEKPRSTSRRSRTRQTRTRAQPAPRGGYHAKVSLAEARRALLQQYFEEQDTLTATQYRALFSVPAAKASQELRRLTDARLLIQRGKKRGTKYIVGVELF